MTFNRIEEIKKYLERSNNGNAIFQNLQNAAKTVLRGKFIAINLYISKNNNNNNKS